MTEPIIKISTDKKNWDSAVSLIKNQDVTLFFQVNTGTASSIKMFIPVVGVGGVADKGIMTAAAWDALLPVTEPESSDSFDVEKDGTPNKAAINITPYNDVNFVFSISFKAVDKVLVTDCGYEYKAGGFTPKPSPGQFAIELVDEAVMPTISRFVTSSAALLVSEDYTLSWEVYDAEKLYILDAGRQIDVHSLKSINGTPSAGKKTVRLVATSGTKPDGSPLYTAEKNITILGGVRTDINPVPDPFAGGLLLNLVKKDENTMYGLVKDQNKNEVWLWETNDGVTWRNTQIKFNENIPAAAACSSGVYYNGRIYLIGGSRFDPNEKSDKVYYLDFSTGEWQGTAETGFDERMGQAVVVVKNDPNQVGDIYMLGGYGHEGTRKDIFTFNGSDGWKHKFNMDTALCLHTAVFRNGQLQVFGGNTQSPSHADQRMKDAAGSAILSDDKSWKSLNFEDSTESPMFRYNIVTCAMAMYKGNTFLFGLYEDGTAFQNITLLVEGLKLGNMGTGNYTALEYCSSLQAVEFKEAIWLYNVYDNDTLISEGLKYFLYQPSNPRIK